MTGERYMQQQVARLARADRRALRVLAGLPPRDARPVLVVYGIDPPAVAGRRAGKRAPQPRRPRGSRWSGYERTDRPQPPSAPCTPVAAQARHVRVGAVWLNTWFRCGRDAGATVAALAACRLRGHLRRHIASVRLYVAWMSDQWVPWDGQHDSDLRAVRTLVERRQDFDFVALDPATREAVGVSTQRGVRSVIVRGDREVGSARSPRLGAICCIARRAHAGRLPTPADVTAAARYVQRKAPLLRPNELAWALRVCAQMERGRREMLRSAARNLRAGHSRRALGRAAWLVANRRERRRLARAVIYGVYVRAMRAMGTQREVA